MIIEKENDMILNMLANPDFTVTDFLSVGLKGENTNLRSEDEYKASEKITKNEFFLDEDGKFDEAKFHNFYIGAGYFYNQLATQDYNLEILNEAVYGQDNMWVDKSKRVLDYTPKLTKLPNQNLVTNSLDSFGKRGPRTKSISEIAQSQQVYDTKTGEWKDSPNDSFFDNFFETLVLATYDEDEYDPVTGEKLHSEGEYKLNENGTYYYETLGGRDVYGKQVLNKMNVLTTDGSRANKFDFFDSDGIDQKTIGGTVLKNAALVGSMFIPYVGPVVRGLSVLTQMAGLTATLGKLFVGNENETLNNIQGWAKTVNRSTQTEYAAENTWCVENFLNMIGDTVGLLAEQRWIFQNAPYILGNVKGAKAMTKDGYNALKKEKLTDLNKDIKVKDLFEQITSSKNPEKKGMLEYLKGIALLNEKKAIQYADDIVKQALNISEPLARAYMIGLTVQDTYGEAKAAGASDMEAALLTLGYAWGENKLLKTDIGKWIMPELKGDQFKMEAIANALTKDIREASAKYASDKSKKSLVSKLLKVGEKLATDKYAKAALSGTKGLQVVAAHAFSEAAEETSEELLADFSKSIFNTVRWLRGEEALDLGAWEGAADRYLMSALGGFMGGGITSAATNFSVANAITKMDKSQAMQELIYLVNNGKEKEFLSLVEKMNLGNKNLSAKDIIDQGEEGFVWGEAKKGDNQDLAIKQLLKNEVNFIRNVLEAEGAKISTESLLNKLTLEDLKEVIREFKLQGLLNTLSMGLYLQNFLNLQNDIVTLHSRLSEISDDNENNDSEEIIGKRSMLKKQLKEKQEKILQYLSGNIVPEAIRDAIYEINPLLSNNLIKTALPFYAQRMFGKKWQELSDAERKEAIEKHKLYSDTSMKNDVHEAAGIYYDMLELFTPFATQAQEYVGKLQLEESKPVLELQTTIQNILEILTNVDVNSEGFDADSHIGLTQSLLDTLGQTTAEVTAIPFMSLTILELLKNIRLELQQIETRPIDDIYTDDDKKEEIREKTKEYTDILQNAVLDMLDTQIQSFIKIGYVNPEVKQALLTSLSVSREFAQDKYDKVPSIVETMNLGDPLLKHRMEQQLKAKYSSDIKIIEVYRDQIKKLSSTPILEYLDLFRLSTTNSDLNLSLHWKNTQSIFADNQEELDMFTVDSDWTQDNEEALNLIDAFIAVVNGMKVDNASFDNPTGYTKILNNIYRRQGVKDFVELTELDSQTADLIIQDAQVIKLRLEFAKQLSTVNQGLKLKQQDKVAVNKNYLVFNLLKKFVDIVPDDWDKDELESRINLLSTLADYAERDIRKLSKDDRIQIEQEMLKAEDAIYDFFDKNKASITPDKLGELLNAFAGKDGFFQKTGDLLTENSTALDKNSFIWWLAARAAVKASDFYGAYKGSITDKIAPIASQELATYLGVAAIANMDVLNSFVDAYRNTVINEFNNTSEEERKKLITNFDSNSEGYAKELLKYFGGHNVLPLYRNMIFVEGIPGSGKSKGVFSNIINIVKNIDPEILKEAMYVHATEEAASEANGETGLNGSALERTKFLLWVSSEWKDTKHNIKTEKTKDGAKITGLYLYDNSYEFNSEGQLINKWKLNQYTDVPKVIFIDEITHYNQLELSMIELFARENGIIVITAGDMDLDTQVAYVKTSDDIFDMTIDRNNFIRTPKLGVSLRTLNKQMTQSVALTQIAMQQINKGDTAELQFTYLDKDPNHKGLYGVKMTLVDTDTISDALMEEIKQTIDLMMQTSSEPIGYIYSDANSKLFKYLEATYGKDKINFYKDSDAQGLEGQYYIVEPKRSKGSTVSLAELSKFMRSIYTGISRAEQGVLLVAPSSFGNITNLSHKEDAKFLLESITEPQKKKVSDARRELLELLLEGLDPQPISIKAPTKHTNIIQPALNTQQPLPPPIPNTPPVPSRLSNGGYTNKQEAEDVLNLFNLKLSLLGKLEDIVVNINGLEIGITETNLVEGEENGIKYWSPYVLLEDGNVMDLQELAKYVISTKTNNNVIQAYNVNDEIIIEQNGVTSNVRISSVNNTNGDFEYEIQNIDDGSIRTITQSDLQQAYKGAYVPPVQTPDATEPNDSILENGTAEEYERAIIERNIEPEENPNVGKLTHKIYTFNSMEMGVTRDSNGKPKFEGPQEKFEARIDNAIGLLNLEIPNAAGLIIKPFANYDYDSLVDLVAYLHGVATTTENLADLANEVKLQLRLPGNVGIRFAIKSSAGRLSKDYAEYNRYDIDDSKEELLYIHSDDPKNAKKPMRKNIVMLVTNDDKTVFELTLGSLNSPLTLILQEIQGQKIFPEEYRTFATAMTRTGDNLYESIQEVIQMHDGGPNQDLINLFKMWLFTSNGIFYFPENFSITSGNTRGVELVNQRGDNQLDGNLQFTDKFINIEELAKDKRLKISSIFASKDGIVNNETIINPGHSFILVSDNPKYNSDKALIDLYVRQQDKNYTGKLEVKLFYVVPPKTTVSDWIVNQHNLWEQQSGNAGVTVYDIGNDFTAYRILDAILKSGLFDTLKSSDDTATEVKQALSELNAIKDKWLADDVLFSNNLEKLDYERIKTKLGEKVARNHMMFVEQKALLQKTVDWNVVTGPVTTKKSLAKMLSSYLTNMVWFKSPGNTRPVRNDNVLQTIERLAIQNGVKDIFYKPQYSKDEVGPFIKIVTKNKWSIGRVNSSDDAHFQIHAKLDTRSLNLDISKSIAFFVDKCMYFSKKDKNYKMTSIGLKYEEKYLNTVSVSAPTISQQIEHEYLKFFDSGELNRSVLQDLSLSREALLIKLAEDYISKRGNFGFVYNGKLHLTKLDNPDLLIINPRVVFDELIPYEFTLWDSSDNLTKRKIQFEVDNAGNVTEVKCLCTNMRIVDVNALSSDNILLSDSEVESVKASVEQAFERVRFGKPTLFNDVNTTEELIVKLGLAKSTNIGKLVSDLKRIKSKLTETNDLESVKIIDKMLNYANSVATFNLNIDDIVVVGNTRYKVTAINGNSISAIDMLTNQLHLFEETEIQNMKKEEPECAPLTWKLI